MNSNRTRKTKPQGMRISFESPRKSGLAKIKSETVRIGTNGTREGFKFAERLMQSLPELRTV